MNQEQTNITTGKQIRHLRTQLGMTQEELAGELNVTRQALSNRKVNELETYLVEHQNKYLNELIEEYLASKNYNSIDF